MLNRGQLIAALEEERDMIDQVIRFLAGGSLAGTAANNANRPSNRRRGKRKVSAAARRKMAEAQKRRWAAVRAAKGKKA